MRQVRRKSMDPVSRSYLLKAKKEGIELSWNYFEKMIPQDGFGRLGLTCLDCLQGPCRLNPFTQKEERTVCGLTSEDLVYNNMLKLINKSGKKFSNDLEGLNNVIHSYTESLKNLNGQKEFADTKRTVGLGVLKQDYVNICLENVSDAGMKTIEKMAQEFKQEAVSRGAQGYNIVLAGDVSPYYEFNSVSNRGSTEFAVLTGILDLYVVGAEALGLGKNVTSCYHTVYLQEGALSEEKVKDWLIQAAVAYAQRDNDKILTSDQMEEVHIANLKKENIKAHLEQGAFKGICLIGGSSNIKVTEDALLCEAVQNLSGQGVLCITYGNAAVTLAKYGYLSERAAHEEEGSYAYCLGGEEAASVLLDFVDYVGTDKVIGLFPELSTSKDLLTAFSLAQKGVKVYTSINLPVDGSQKASEEIGKLIQYCEPKELMGTVLKTLTD